MRSWSSVLRFGEQAGDHSDSVIPLPVCMAESQWKFCGGGENEDDYWSQEADSIASFSQPGPLWNLQSQLELPCWPTATGEPESLQIKVLGMGWEGSFRQMSSSAFNVLLKGVPPQYSLIMCVSYSYTEHKFSHNNSLPYLTDCTNIFSEGD